MLTVSESDNSIKSIEYDWRVDHLIVVQLPQIFYLSDAALVELKIILFQTQVDLFKNIVNDHDDKVLVVAVQRSKEDSKKMDIAVFHFPWFGKYLLHDIDNLSALTQSILKSDLNPHILFLPVQLANRLKNLRIGPFVHV